jgi:hypothetical protein
VYVLNVDQLSVSDDRIFRCDELLGDWLIHQCRVPLLARDSKKRFCFMRTKYLDEMLELSRYWYDPIGRF